LYTLERDEDGVWCAAALIRPGAGAVGDGITALGNSLQVRL